MWLERAEARPDAVFHVAEHMREWDRREIFATRICDDPDLLARDFIDAGPVSWVAGLDEPIAAFGCLPMWRGVWSMSLFATDSFPRIATSVTKLIIKQIVPMLFEAGAHRLEARSMEGHEDAQRWMTVIGAHREGTQRGFGRDGEDFHTYVWTKP
jgi:hypothetical protein